MLVGLVCLAVVIKLVTLQVFQAQDLTQEAEARRSQVAVLHAKRGTIYDRNGNVLAMSKACETIYCNPREVNDPSGAAAIIARECGGDASTYLSRMRGDGTFSYVARQVDTEDADSIREDFAARGVEGLYFLEDTKRIYPYGAVGGQVLGMVGIDGDGLSGLELYYDDVLKGEDGKMVLETGAGGTPIAGGNSHTTEAKDGTDIVISLDIDIQRVAEQTISEGITKYSADSGSVVVTNPSNGEILAACSTPLFDITNTSNIADGALALKPVSSSYEPGSIFKVLTTAIGLDAGKISTSDVYTVPGKVKVGDDLVGDDDGRTETMTMDLRELLRRSSNTGMALVAQDYIGETTFAQGVSKFQIGKPTGIDYPGEVEGLVKQLNQYDGASLGTMSFGQSLAVPSIQMIRAIGSIANGGTLQTPHFLMSKGGQTVDWPSGGTTVSKDSAATTVDLMRSVMEPEGTGALGVVKGYDIAGKTGTGEQADENGYIEGKLVSSLIGFAPASDPVVMVYAALNGTPYLASDSAAPLFSTIMGEALSDLGLQPSS